MSQKRGRSPTSQDDDQVEVFKSDPIEDRTSIFIAAYSPSMGVKELQAISDFSDASHRMAAWRKVSKQKSLSAKPLFDSSHDDDGEQYAGKKLENLLWNLDIAGSIVVGRWFGGVLLGPIRFTHIENCAKEAIRRWKEAEAEKNKRRKLEEEEAAQKIKLIAALEQRDESIRVLRSLLAEKQASSEPDKTSPTTSEVASPRAKVNYAAMNLMTLKRLEKARDGTLKWILNELDKAEQPPIEPPAESTTADTAENGGSLSDHSDRKSPDLSKEHSLNPPSPKDEQPLKPG